MSATFLLLQSHPDHGPDLLADLLASRARPMTVVARHDGAELPDRTGVRALVVLGGAAPDEEVKAYAAACVAADIPVLALGLGAGALLDDVTAVEAEVAGVSPTAEAKGDELFEGLDADTGFVRTARLTPTADAVVVASFDGEPAAVRLGERAYALAFSPEHDAAWLIDRPPAESDEEAAAALTRRNRILRPHTVALLGRWVDGVVGRTEDEAPWGRSGPPPEARAGLYLNPA